MLVDSNSQVAFIKDVLMLFVLAIDSLPALLKTLLCVGRRSLYETTQDATEHAAESAVQAEEALRCGEAQRATEEQLRMQAEVTKARIDGRIELQKEMDDTSIKALQESIRPHVERWAQTMAERYAAQLAADLENGPPPSRERPGQTQTARSERRADRSRGLGRRRRRRP